MNKLMAEEQLIKAEALDGGAIWVLSLNNPPANLLTQAMLTQLTAKIGEFEKHSSSRVLIVTGAGQIFSAGANIDEILAISSRENGVALAKLGQSLCDQIENLNKPVIAAINGLCNGGGNELAMACHFRIASQKAKFQQPEINLGIIPGFGGTQRLCRIIGVSRARKLILTGESITAEQAFQFGLIDEIVATEEVLNEALFIARKILQKSPAGILQAQIAINRGVVVSIKKGLEIELECFGNVCNGPDMREGLTAYKEKRAPKYRTP